MQTYVKARIDSELKSQVEAICKKMGISMSDYIRLSFSRLLQEDEQPTHQPNKTTQKAIAELENGKGKRGNVADIMAIFDQAASKK